MRSDKTLFVPNSDQISKVDPEDYLQCLELRTPKLILRVASPTAAHLFGEQVASEGVFKGPDPYDDEWSQLTGAAQAAAFTKMLNDGRTSLLKKGPFSLPFIAYTRGEEKPVAVFDIRDTYEFKKSGKFEAVVIVTLPNQQQRIAADGLLAINTAMYDAFNATQSQCDALGFNTTVQDALTGWNYRNAGKHPSKRTGRTTYEFVADRETYWSENVPRMFSSGDSKVVNITGLHSFLKGVDPKSDLLGRVSLENGQGHDKESSVNPVSTTAAGGLDRPGFAFAP